MEIKIYFFFQEKRFAYVYFDCRVYLETYIIKIGSQN